MSYGELAARMSLDDSQVNQAVANVLGGMDQLKQRSEAAGAAVARVGKGMASTTPAVSQFSSANAKAAMMMQQVAFTVQDMPMFMVNMRMGLLSVGNNIGFIVSQLGMLKSEMGGAQSMMALVAQTLRGPTGLVIGFSALLAIVQAVAMATGDAEKELNQYNETAQEFSKELSKIGSPLELEERRRKNAERLEAVQKEITALRGKDFQIIQLSEHTQTTGAIKREQLLQEQSRLMAEYFQIELRIAEVTKTRKLPGIIEQLDYQIKQKKTLLEQEHDLTKIQQIQDDLVRLEQTKEALTKSTGERQNEALDAAQKELELEVRRTEARAGSLESERKAYDTLLGIIRDAEAKTGTRFEQQRTQERQRHEEAMADIAALEAQTLDHDLAAEARAAELHRYKMALLGIEADEKEKQDRDEAERARDLAQDQHELAMMMMSVFNQVGDNFISKMGKALAIVYEMLTVMRQMESKEGGQTMDWLKLISGGLGLFGLFKSGGFTGSGQAHEPAGIVHRGEIVFEKPIVDVYKNELLSMRAALRHGYRTGGYVGGLDSMSPTSGAVLAELRALREAVAEMAIQQPIVFNNVLDTQRIVRQEFPSAERYTRRKRIQ